jgi:hypothetical protein
MICRKDQQAGVQDLLVAPGALAPVCVFATTSAVHLGRLKGSPGSIRLVLFARPQHSVDPLGRRLMDLPTSSPGASRTIPGRKGRESYLVLYREDTWLPSGG